MVEALQRTEARARARILVVDDDPDIRRILVRTLEDDGYRISEASSGEEMTSSLSVAEPDLILLDVMLGPEDGFDLLTSIRRSSEIPVILLTAKGAEVDRVLGLRLGADDYILKPFSPAELSARVATVLRRTTRPLAPSTPVLQFGPLRIDLSSREVRMGDELLETTLKEFDLLAFLASSPRQVFSREQLLEHVWSSSSAWQDDGTVTEHIRRIRSKLGDQSSPHRWIRTVRGVGYCFEP